LFPLRRNPERRVHHLIWKCPGPAPDVEQEAGALAGRSTPGHETGCRVWLPGVYFVSAL
jgi:hypothetical protein